MTEAHTDPFTLPLQYGGRLARCRLAWRLTGPRERESPTLLVMGGISADRRVAGDEGWWPWAVGPGCPIDTRSHRVLSFDYVGGRGDSTAEWKGGLDRDGVGVVSTRDHADTVAALLDHLALERLDAVIGASFGGAIALALAARHPERVGRLLVIGAAEAPHPLATAVRVVQRRIVREGLATGRTIPALHLARAIAITTYRSEREFDARFGEPVESFGQEMTFSVERYLDHNAERFAATWSAAQYLCLSRAIDLHRVEPSAVRCPVTVVAVSGDRIAPPWQLDRLANRLAHGSFVEIDSLVGHDAFLADPDQIVPVLRRFQAPDEVAA